jgi:hypothetical protein
VAESVSEEVVSRGDMTLFGEVFLGLPSLPTELAPADKICDPELAFKLDD